MPHIKLIADSGSTKAEWCLINGKSKKMFTTQGMSPYFLSSEQIENIIQQELKSKINTININELFFYGTGCSNPENIMMVKNALKNIFNTSNIEVRDDLIAAARALCGNEKGIACILGTGSNSCYYNGEKIVKNIPGLGFILGDEGSGAYLGRKVIQHYLYKIFDDELMKKFDNKFGTNSVEILNAVYKGSLANRYLASYTIFLAENRGNYMIENIIEDGLNDFFFSHISNYKESSDLPINFVGSIAFGFKDILQGLCNNYNMKLGKVLKNTIDGLIEFHKN